MTAPPLPPTIKIADRTTHYVLEPEEVQEQGIELGGTYRWLNTRMECIAIFGDGSALLRMIG